MRLLQHCALGHGFSAASPTVIQDIDPDCINSKRADCVCFECELSVSNFAAHIFIGTAELEHTVYLYFILYDTSGCRFQGDQLVAHSCVSE